MMVKNVRILSNLANTNRWKGLMTMTLSQGNIINVNRNYSMYPPFYEKPVYREVDQEKLIETGEATKLTYIPILPAATYHNASVWHDPLVIRFTHHIMREGNINRARYHVDNCFERIKRDQLEKYNNTVDVDEKEKIIINPWKVFHTAVENVKPLLELVKIKKGGHTYQVPVPLTDYKAIWHAFKWFNKIASERDMTQMPNYPKHNIKFANKLATEFIDASSYKGKAIKRKHDLHQQCEANKAYAHYRWG